MVIERGKRNEKECFPVAVILCAVVLHAEVKWTQNKLEEWVYSKREGVDDLYHFPDLERTPEWQLDSLSEYKAFIIEGGWSTNDLVEGLALAVTNRLSVPSWTTERDETIAALSFDALSKINHPLALRLVQQICTNGTKTILGEGLAGVFRYSRFESEVFDFMRTVCVQTNEYERWARKIAFDMCRCFEDRPDYYNEAATNGLARYNYFVIRHATKSVGVVDRMLAGWTPAYSNSVQRLKAMQYVSNTATNAAMVRWARRQVDRLSAMPTNELNNVSWLEE